ncbi:MAG: diaminopimelate decarboxylase [Deltaproteobacteria bacterium]|nr:diaminopimelate decarboxylase [Deltaproteobacteria bacterium]
MSFREVLTRREAALYLEEVAVADLAERFGTPLYVYSRGALIERVERLRRAFEGTPHLLAYSVKANMNLAIVRTFLDHGCGADVTSRGELERALRAGADPRMIVYSGVGKRADEIERALEVGIRMFNVESLEELITLDARAQALGKVAPISFRLNPDVDPETHPKIATGLRSSKFGIPIEDAAKAYAHAESLPNVRVAGVDCHIGSQMTSLGPLRDALLRIKNVVLALHAQGHRIELIDIGGGLGVEYSGHDDPPTPEAYAALALEVLGGLDATLVCEPGRVLTAGAGIFVTRALYRKQNADRKFLIVDGGMNDLLRPALYQAEMRIETDPLRAGDRAPVDIVGPVCETTDRFAEQRALPNVEPGDLVVIRDAGAYGFAMASGYNGRPLVAEVMVDGSRAELIRRRQTLEETWQGESIPEWDR